MAKPKKNKLRAHMAMLYFLLDFLKEQLVVVRGDPAKGIAPDRARCSDALNELRDVLSLFVSAIKRTS